MSDDNLTPPPVPVPPVAATPLTPASAPPPPPYSAPPVQPTAAGYGAEIGSNVGRPKKGLAVASFVIGIVSVVLFWTAWFASLLGVVALVLGFIARSRNPGAPRWMWITGIILGFLGLIGGVIVTVVYIALAAYVQSHPELLNK